jgi:signal transduction histidine kinase
MRKPASAGPRWQKLDPAIWQSLIITNASSMTTATSSEQATPEAESEQLVIAPVSLMARIMLICTGLGLIIALFNLILFAYSRSTLFLVPLMVCLACAAASVAGWRLALQNRTTIAATMLSIITCIGAVVSIWVSYNTLPLAMSLIVGGVLVAMPYLSVKAFRATIYFSTGVFVLVGLIYVFNQPADTTLLFLTRIFIFISCLLIVLVMAYLVYRSSIWMHTVVRDMRNTNETLREVKIGLEMNIQGRMAELTQINEALTHEIDERRRAEEQLRSQKAFLEALHDTSLGMVNRLDMQELLQSILAKASALMQVEDAFLDLVDRAKMKTRSSAAIGAFEVVVPYEFDQGEGLVGTVWKLGRTVVVDDYAEWEGRSPHAVTSNIHAAVGVPLFVDGAVFGIIGMVRQTPGHVFGQHEVALLERFANLASIACDNAQLYATVRANEQALEERVQQRTRELTAALAENDVLRAQAVKTAMAEERSRLARDLHDSVSQAIYGIVLGTRTLQQLLVASKPADEQLNQVVEYIISLADAALTEMRALIFELRPESLQQEGVLAAIRKQCDVMQVRYGLQIDQQLGDEEPAIPIEVKEAIYRIIIEATHNVVKHANARRISVRLFVQEGNLTLQIIDDGIGFEMSGVQPGRLGLKTMQERAAKLGGTTTLKSARGEGTEVRVEIPLPAPAPAQHA